MMRWALSFLLLVAAAGMARAGDGQLEINQACVATGCVPGDAPGFPIETQAGQSYLLTSNLVVPSANTQAVSLADRASLDLGAFAIEGVTSCSGTPLVCSNAGTGDGIVGAGHNAVRNGAIRKMGRHGYVGYRIQLEDVVVEQNGGDGAHVASGPGTTIRDCVFDSNGGSGLTTSWGAGATGSLVTNSVFHANGVYGIEGGRFALLGNVVSDNGSFGLRLVYGTVGGAQNVVIGNNGGDANPQVQGSWLVPIDSNVCGTDTVCP